MSVEWKDYSERGAREFAVALFCFGTMERGGK
jgi:hypothetical protein